MVLEYRFRHVTTEGRGVYVTIQYSLDLEILNIIPDVISEDEARRILSAEQDLVAIEDETCEWKEDEW